ncbi:hypothetical protein DJ535_08330 [Citrobacter murliniae]|uniref:Uncharacterized protein n=1 Tax=Citrobacter murliniae TaxID=67829 RepID=A0ABY2PVJ9_9ENTR|nr:hypothetical protein DJ535_08330 [Citrobacter murliniae]
MNNINCVLENYLNTYSSLLTKIFLVLLLILWFRTLLLRRRKKQSSVAAIAAADARERYQWRYFRWSLQSIQIAFYLYLTWSIIKYLLT